MGTGNLAHFGSFKYRRGLVMQLDLYNSPGFNPESVILLKRLPTLFISAQHLHEVSCVTIPHVGNRGLIKPGMLKFQNRALDLKRTGEPNDA